MMGNFSNVHLSLAWVTSGKLQNQQRIIIIHFSWIFFLPPSLSCDWLEMFKILENFFTSARVLVCMDAWGETWNLKREPLIAVRRIWNFVFEFVKISILTRSRKTLSSWDALWWSGFALCLSYFRNIIQNL